MEPRHESRPPSGRTCRAIRCRRCRAGAGARLQEGHGDELTKGADDCCGVLACGVSGRRARICDADVILLVIIGLIRVGRATCARFKNELIEGVQQE